MEKLDEKIFRDIVAFAIAYPEKLARTLRVDSDHQRQCNHYKPVTLIMREDAKNIFKSMTELRCGDCGNHLHGIDFDDITRAFADIQLKPCPFCGSDARIAEMYHGDSSPWLEIHCKNPKCGITMNARIGTVSHYQHYHVEQRHMHRMLAVDKWNLRIKEEKAELVEA